MAAASTRQTGAITSWNDERGFGFITPTGGGRDVFIHISEFGGGSARPVVGDVVTFAVRTAHDGKLRAAAVSRIRLPGRSPRRAGRARCRTSLLALLIIPAFAACVYAASVVWSVPLLVIAIYVVASILCFLLYAADKSAARAGRWRRRLPGAGAGPAARGRGRAAPLRSAPRKIASRSRTRSRSRSS